MKPSLDGKACIVTGASKGLGRAIAVRLSELGCHIVVNYNTHREEAEETVRLIKRNRRRALLVKADISKISDVEALARQAVDAFGKIDVLVNNAGIFMVKPSLDLTEEEWDRTIDVNLKGTFLCSQIVGRLMIEKRSGVIINISSVAALASFPKRAAYCAAKAGIIALTKTLGIEWAQYNVRVNAVVPAFIDTEEMRVEVKRGILDVSSLLRRTPMKRLGHPREVAAAVAFLVSDEASYMTGETVSVDGGWLAYGYI